MGFHLYYTIQAALFIDPTNIQKSGVYQRLCCAAHICFRDKNCISNYSPFVQTQLFSQMSLVTNLVRLVLEGFLLPAVGCLGLVSFVVIVIVIVIGFLGLVSFCKNQFYQLLELLKAPTTFFCVICRKTPLICFSPGGECCLCDCSSPSDG